MKGHLQHDVVCHGCLRRVMSPCWAAEPGDRGVCTGVEVVGSCCCGFSCLLWIVSCLNPDTETPGRRCFLLQEESAGWGGGRHEVSAVGWFHAGLCPFWSRSREPGSPAGARGERGAAGTPRRPGTPAGAADGGVGPATRALSPEASRELLGRWAALSGHARPLLHPQLSAPCSPSIQLRPGTLRRGGTAPRRSVPASRSALTRDFHKPHLSLFSLWSCLGSRLAHRDFSHHALQGELVISKPRLVCS